MSQTTSSAAPQTTHLHHIAIRCIDVPRSVTFYQSLGYREVHSWALPAYRIAQAVMMQSPDGQSWLELFDANAQIPLQGRAAKAGAEVVSGALCHLCLCAPDIDGLAERAIAAGARLLHGPEALSLGTPAVAVRNLILEGPAGEIIELLEPLRFPGDQVAHASQ